MSLPAILMPIRPQPSTAIFTILELSLVPGRSKDVINYCFVDHIIPVIPAEPDVNCSGHVTKNMAAWRRVQCQR